MTETMTLDDWHVVLSYLTDFEGVDLEAIEHLMRPVEPAFSSEARH
jgi:hypothetical protein